VRESSTFWHKLALHSQLAENTDGDVAEPAQWLSTHPNHESRAQKLDDMIPAVSLQSYMNGALYALVLYVFCGLG